VEVWSRAAGLVVRRRRAGWWWPGGSPRPVQVNGAAPKTSLHPARDVNVGPGPTDAMPATRVQIERGTAVVSPCRMKWESLPTASPNRSVVNHQYVQ
jgi:hypothetical protein